MRAAVALVTVGVLLGCTLLSSVVLGVPLVSDQQLREYAEVAAELRPVEVPWQALVALDAVRYRQDFSRVTKAFMRETAALFVACRREVERYSYTDRLGRVGAVTRHPLRVPVPSEVNWKVEERQGGVRTELQNSLDQPVAGNLVEPGYYTLLVQATEAPAEYHLELEVIAGEKVCYGRSLDDVMASLGFSPEDREMARELLNAFEEAGPVEFKPNPDSRFTWPVAGAVTSRFGYRVSPTGGEWEFHPGLDIAAAEGSPVWAAAAGEVVEAGWSGNYGLLVRIRRDGFETVYGHLSGSRVSQGEEVGQGQVIGSVGNTGRSTGPHLHFEWWEDGRPVDPLRAYR